MKLSECEILPGIVINVDDPEHLGRVKAMVPTWFDTRSMEEEALPWVYPFKMKGYQTFSKMEKGRKIWVLHNYENDMEYWYWPMFELEEKTKEIVDEYNATEVLMSRSCGGSGSAYIYYNDTDGIVIRIGETKINITSNNEIHVTDGEASVKIVGGHIDIGKSDNLEQAILGNKLKELIDNLGGTLEALGAQNSSSLYVSPLATGLVQLGKDIKAQSASILSDTVKISK